MSDKKDQKTAISKEVALNEFYDFIRHWERRPEPIEVIEQDYEDCIEAMQLGNLVIQPDFTPTYKLEQPVKSESGEVVYETITFKTRVLPNTAIDLTKGLTLPKDNAIYQLVVLAHVTGVSTRRELDKFGKFDYKIMRDIAGLFL